MSTLKRKQQTTPFKILLFIILGLSVLITLFPLYWLVRTGLTSSKAIVTDPKSFLPPDFTFLNFGRVLGLVDTKASVAAGGSGQSFNFLLYLRNTIFVAGIITGGQLVFSSFAAYAFARLQFRFRELLFALYLSALMIPGIITVIPNYVLMYTLGWMNTFRGLVAPYLLMTPFSVFFMRQFFLGIHRELEEAALIEGASRLRILFSIIFPISKGSMIIVGLITFTNSWNEYLWMLIMGRKETVRVLTVALGIFKAQTPQGMPDWGGLMSGAFLSAVPIMVLFIFFGKHLVDSIGHTGIK